jgi:two-component system OmpR family response regulator
MNNNYRYSIALIDDDRIFLASLKNSLLHQFKSTIDIFEYNSGEDFILNVGKKPDIVILDYYLNDDEHPEAMNGMKVLHELKSFARDSIVIMLSGQDNVEVVTNCLRNGAYEYIYKNESAFVRIPNSIKNAIANIRAKRENGKYIRLKINKNIIIGLLILLDIAGYFIFHFLSKGV